MSAHRGTDRIAFVGENHTVKLARSHPKLFGTSLKQTIEKHGIKYAIDFWQKYDADSMGSFKSHLFHGVAANKREHRIAKQFGNIVVPTLSVMGGVANIQPTTQAVNLDYRDIWGSFVEHLGPKTTKLGHMMEDTSNFGIHKNRVMFVDGGSQGLEHLLQTRAEDIERALGSVGLKLGLNS